MDPHVKAIYVCKPSFYVFINNVKNVEVVSSFLNKLLKLVRLLINRYIFLYTVYGLPPGLSLCLCSDKYKVRKQ